MPSNQFPRPIDVAEAGGRHAGFLAPRVNNAPDDLTAEAGSLRARAAEHGEKILRRVGYNTVSADPTIQAKADAGRTRHLRKEIRNFTDQAEICEELARRNGDGES